MKKLLIILCICSVFILTGCGITFGSDSSKVDEIAEAGEKLGTAFTDAKLIFSKLEEKKSLSSDDQKEIDQQISQLREVIDNFKAADAPFLVKKAKEAAMEEINKKEEILIEIQERAKNGEAKPEDLKLLVKTVKEDFEIKLWDK